MTEASPLRAAAAADGPTLAGYLRRVARIPEGNDDQHLVRAIVLEQAADLDAGISRVLGVRLASSESSASYLSTEVFSRLSTDVRRRMLADLLGDELTERWPFVLPIIKRVFELRNQMAHGFVHRHGGTILVEAHNRGRVTTHSYTSLDLAWLIRQSVVVQRELRLLWVHLLPEVDAWFDVTANAKNPGVWSAID